MSAQKPSIPKGTRDFGPEEVAKRKYILNTIEQVFIKYGFMPIETPTMEKVETLMGKYGNEGDKLIFKILPRGEKLKPLLRSFENIKDVHDSIGQDLTSENINPLALDALSESLAKDMAEEALRYDLTVPFARYVVMHQNEIAFPFKRYQMQPVWRADRPQKGRYREFWQCDADVVGSDSLLNEVDLIQIYDEAFVKLGITNYELRVNNRKLLAGLAEAMGSYDQFADFTTILDKVDKVGIDAVLTEMYSKGLISSEELLRSYLNYLNSSKSNEEKLNYLKTTTLNKYKVFQEGVSEIEYVVSNCVNLKSEINLKIDGVLARGLSYYTGCIFEVVVNDERCSLKSSIGGGGRYDNLTGIFGLPNVSGVGISFGLDRIYDVMEELNLFPASLNQSSTRLLFCCFDDASIEYALPLLKKVRGMGIASEIYPKAVKIKKQLDYANVKKVPFACIIGENEMKTGKLVLKDLHLGTQQELTIDEVIAVLKS